MTGSVLIGESYPVPTRVELHRIFERALAEHPSSSDGRDAGLIYGGRLLPYAEINRTANRLARCLLARTRLKRGQPPLIAVCMEPSEKLVITLLAIVKVGAAYVPIDPTFPPARTNHILENSGPVFVIYDGHIPSALMEALTPYDILKSLHQLETVNYEHMLEFMSTNDYSDENLSDGETVQNSENLACVLYTSGSTGTPKGVKLPHRQILNRLQFSWRRFPYCKDEVICFKTSLTFVDSLTEIFGSLLKLKSLLVVPREIVKDPERLVSLLTTYRCHRLVLVPSLLRSILLHMDTAEPEEQETLLKDLQLVISSGEPLQRELLEQFFERFNTGQRICNFFGSTEVTADVTYVCFENSHEGTIEGKVPIGIPLDNTSIYIVDDQMELVPVGHVGEICVGGLNVSPGYFKEETNQSTKFGVDPFLSLEETSTPGYGKLYHTGDFGRIVDGTVVYEGRTDSQVKIRGHRIDLGEVESAMLTTPGIDKAVVLVRQPKGKDEHPKLIGFYTLRNDTDISFKEVINYLRRHLCNAMMPLPFPVDAFPFLHNGKIDRQSLLRQFEKDKSEDWQHSKEIHDDPVARDLLNAVSSVVGIRHPGLICLENSYYDIGGDSLNSVLLIMELRKSGYYLEIQDLASSNDLRELLQKLKTANHSMYNGINEYKTSIFPGTNAGPPLSFRPIVSSRRLEFRPLSKITRDSAIHLIATSFAQKGELECCVGSTEEDYSILLEDIWDTLIDTGLSFGIVSGESEELVAVATNTDMRSQNDITYPDGLKAVFDFLRDVEQPMVDKLRAEGGDIMHAGLMSTSEDLSDVENIGIVKQLEEENIRIAKENNFQYIITTNTNPLTRDLCREFLGYNIFREVYPYEYVDKNGERPFKNASKNFRAEVVYKKIT